MNSSVLCVVGSRIGPRCLASFLESGGFGQVTVAPTPKCEASALESVLAKYAGRVSIAGDLTELFGQISSRRTRYDWLLNLWGEVILPEGVLSGVGDSVNIHPAMLPYGRGSDPAIWTLRNHWPAGVSLHRITSEVDGGPVWSQRKVNVAFPCRGVDLYTALLEACAQLFADVWPAIRDGIIVPKDQLPVGLPTHKRRHLLEDQVLALAETDLMSVRTFVDWLLAYDFGDEFSAILSHDGLAYRARIVLEPVEYRHSPYLK